MDEEKGYLLEEWVVSKLKVCANSHLVLGELYNDYVKDASEIPVSKKMFAKCLRQFFPSCTQQKQKIRGKNYTFITSISFSNEKSIIPIVNNVICLSTEHLRNSVPVKFLIKKDPLTISLDDHVIDYTRHGIRHDTPLLIVCRILLGVKLCRGKQTEKSAHNTVWSTTVNPYKCMSMCSPSCQRVIPISDSIDYCRACKHYAHNHQKTQASSPATPQTSTSTPEDVSTANLTPTPQHRSRWSESPTTSTSTFSPPSTPQQDPLNLIPNTSTSSPDLELSTGFPTHTSTPESGYSSDSCRQDVSFSAPSTPQQDPPDGIHTSTPISTPEPANTSLEEILKEKGVPIDKIDILSDSINNEGVPKRRRRWSPGTIRACLSWWVRDANTYKFWSEKGQLLPHPSTLAKYKNCLQQRPGFIKESFQWMKQEADRLNLSINDRAGGIVFDEMSIQDDLTAIHRGMNSHYSGLVEMTPLCNTLIARRKGQTTVQLATHILQMVYVTPGGFRFPFAHFATQGAQAPEIYILLWEAVDHLEEHSFKVHYTIMDGAQGNRTFVNMHFNGSPRTDLYTAPHPLNPNHRKFIFMMDPKHQIKKMRNNVIKSGVGKAYTRDLTHSTGLIRWEHFVSAYEWDVASHGMRLHRKLSTAHMNPTNRERMRNSLAEDCLDKEMLNLLTRYRDFLERLEKGSGEFLNASITFLSQTSHLVRIFNTFEPIQGMDDPRLDKLNEVLTWFNDWEHDAKKHKNSAKRLLSHQTREDLNSLVGGFIELCRENLKLYGTSVVPGRMNSDIVENIFCQQRTLCHGANTNPTVYQYGFGLNTIILSEANMSRKRNSFGSTDPLNILPGAKKPKV